MMGVFVLRDWPVMINAFEVPIFAITSFNFFAVPLKCQICKPANVFVENTSSIDHELDRRSWIAAYQRTVNLASLVRKERHGELFRTFLFFEQDAEAFVFFSRG
jgi:hypothetical protein